MLNRWQRTIVDLRGNVVSYAQLQVRAEATQAAASIYRDSAGTEAIPNGIVTANAQGYAYFYAPAGLYRITSAEPVIDWRHVPLGELAHMDVADLGLRENIKVTVGSGGDFPTINEAVLHLSRFTPDLGVTAEVELMSGFVMSEQLLVEGLGLGWITITGVDAETVINEPSLTRILVGNNKPAFGVIRGTLPTIGQLFSFSSKGNPSDSRSGVLAHSIGRANILSGCGVKNAGTNGIFADFGSTIIALGGAIASGAGENGISARFGSTIIALGGANVSGAGTNGIFASSGSTISANSAIASGAGENGIFADFGSTINAQGAIASGAGANGIFASSGSTISANSANVSGAGANGISARFSAIVNAQGANASGAGINGILVGEGAIVNAQGATGTLSQAKNTVTAGGIIFRP